MATGTQNGDQNWAPKFSKRWGQSGMIVPLSLTESGGLGVHHPSTATMTLAASLLFGSFNLIFCAGSRVNRHHSNTFVHDHTSDKPIYCSSYLNLETVSTSHNS